MPSCRIIGFLGCPRIRLTSSLVNMLLRFLYCWDEQDVFLKNTIKEIYIFLVKDIPFSQRSTRQPTRGVSALRGLRYDYNLRAHKIVKKLLQNRQKIAKKSSQNRPKIQVKDVRVPEQLQRAMAAEAEAAREARAKVILIKDKDKKKTKTKI